MGDVCEVDEVKSEADSIFLGKKSSHELREYWPQYCKRFWNSVFS